MHNLKKIVVRAGHWQKMVACNRTRLKINTKTIHCSSTRLTCKKEKPPVRGFGLTRTRAKYLCFWCRYGIHTHTYIYIYIFIAFHATEKMKSFTLRPLTYHAMNIYIQFYHTMPHCPLSTSFAFIYLHLP